MPPKVSIPNQQGREKSNSVDKALTPLPKKRKAFKNNALSKKNTRRHKVISLQEKAKKAVRKKIGEKLIKLQKSYQEKCRADKAYAKSEEGKKEQERIRQERINTRKTRRLHAKEIKNAEKRAKRPPKPLYSWKNPVFLNFSKESTSSQGYAMTTPKTGKYVLQTYIPGIPIDISDDQAQKLRDSIGIKNKKSTRQRQFLKTMYDMLLTGNNSDCLAITTVVSKDFKVENSQVLNHQFNVSYNFSNEENVTDLIHNPSTNSRHENLHFNRFVDFAKRCCEHYDNKSYFIEFLNEQEKLPTDNATIDLTPEEMVEALREYGYEYTEKEEITVEKFKDIQKNSDKFPDDAFIPYFKNTPLTAEEMTATLRCYTNKGITKLLQNAKTKDGQKLPFFSYIRNPKCDQKEQSSSTLIEPIAPITNPMEDPRAAFNAIQLQYYIQTKQALFTQEQVNSLISGGLREITTWKNKNPKKKKTERLRIA